MAKKQTVKEPKKIGRPSDYTQDLADKICEYIGNGSSMRSICLLESMPEMQTIWRWLREKPSFSEQYNKATVERAEAHNESLLDFGDAAIELAQEVDPKASGAVVQAYKLKADNLKWSMSKMKPKKYGDKLDVTTGGEKLPIPLLHVLNHNGNDEAKSVDGTN